MRPEDLQVNLRPRSSWEAMELGTALLRRHAAAVWRPWLAVLLVAFVVLNAACWALGAPWLAMPLLWWLKPALERVPLYVLSRAVFGQSPGVVETLRAQARFAPPMLAAHLLWRRLGPARALLVPVDLLEGNAGDQRALRRRAVAGPVYMQAAVLTAVCLCFEWALLLGSVATVFLFVPAEYLPASLQTFGALLQEGAPRWLQLGLNAAAAIALAVVGPFHVAAGFGLYLNRRSESEAWDVELAFRRLRERLLARSATLLLALCAGTALLAAPPLQAQDAGATPHATGEDGRAEAGKNEAGHGEDDDGKDEDGKDEDGPHAPTLPVVFADELADDAAFRRAAARAYADPLIGGSRTVVEWKPKNPPAPDEPRDMPAWLEAISALMALAAEWALWILLGVVVLALLLTAPRWLPWLRGSVRRRAAQAPAEARVDALELPETLPDDIPTAARRLWREGRPRAALALLYRASVEAMASRTGAVLPPGATEAQCLRMARQLPEAAARELFAQMVRVWQYAAYAGRLPEDEAFEDLLRQSQAQWAWAP